MLPIGGADMPVVISLMNSYAGLACSATGFALGNQILIIAGALDGASGFILSIVMSKAMNRSFRNVLFGAFGTVQTTAAAKTSEGLTVRSVSLEDAALQLVSARRVIVIPGYGMAVAQAQHDLRELGELIERAGGNGRIRDSPGRGAHAGAHERASGRSQSPVRQAQGHGRHQRRVLGRRRGAGDRRQRRGESGRAQRSSRARSTGCRS